MRHQVSDSQRAQMELRTLFSAGAREVWVWRLAVLLCLFVILGQGLVVRDLAANQGFVPWVVELNAFKEVRSLGPAERVVEEELLASLHLREFVESMRAYAPTPEINKELFLSGARFVDPARQQEFKYLVREEEGRADGDWSRIAIVRTVLKQREGVWEVTWYEDVISKARVERAEWRGLFEVSFGDSRDAVVMTQNPFNFRVHSWSIQQSGETVEFNIEDAGRLPLYGKGW